ncbi:15-hydroxyprostaglandin dehydrogenase [nad(+)] [Holotrichia oblita]|uniref:15-hydroxyprostaglandin dehydrogenase [nad(+)] n=2 Tax=Holotrichia oblita TaxID=644536 RepID=A0ACB9TXI5_HOLOL|nr:15-hydroxyprostaglandin dehydrogenase [nad(+)] [Holotrichia oblita]KAI4471355.1 15-hydroxyprostaglandin dehydrogenase [nad(+)] [Holotrichia oblita]
MDLKGKVALVTGGASGYGREYCVELLKQGCKVSICDINSDAGEDLLHDLSKQAQDRVIFCPCDVTDYQQYEEAFQTTISKLGGVDIVINNASVMNDRLWELEVDVNLCIRQSFKRISHFRNEFVAKSMVDLIKKAPSGSSWLIENSQAPKEITLFP